MAGPRYKKLHDLDEYQDTREAQDGDGEGSTGSGSADEQAGAWTFFKCGSSWNSCGQPPRSDLGKATCRCGWELPDHAAFCSQCGEQRPVAPKSHAEKMKLELQAIQQGHSEVLRQLDCAQACWYQKKKELEAQLKAKADAKVQLLESMDREVMTRTERLNLPGPGCLHFVEEDVFNFLILTVISINMVVVFQESAHPEYLDDFLWLDNTFLGIYTAELVLKALLWQEHLLLGPLRVVAWHWLDLIIVVGGATLMWVMPLFTVQQQTHVVTPLRLLRLARVLKLCRNFFITDVSWAENEPCQIFIMCLIALSSILMGVEADHPEVTHLMDSICWEQVVLFIFAFELAVRLKISKLRFFYDPQEFAWNWLDFICVMGGVFDQCLIPVTTFLRSLISGETVQHSLHMGQFLVLLRMARLLRVLRLVRLVRLIPQLFNLLSGVAQAMAGMVWVLILTFVVLYFFALLSVKLFRDGLVYGDAEAPYEVRELFDSVPESVFVLFTVMDGHKSILDPLLDSLPGTKVLFMIFVAISEWAMLSILTAVVSENMITVTEDRKKAKESETKSEQDSDRLMAMNTIFSQIDQDKDGTVDLQEFDALMRDDELRTALCRVANLNICDLRMIFNILEENGHVRRRPFIEACKDEGKAVSERSLMKLDKRLAEVERRISKTVITVEGAGIEQCNGTYEETGMHNMKPLYAKMEVGSRNSGSIIFFDLVWKMNSGGDTSSWTYRRLQARYDVSNSEDKWIPADAACGAGPQVRWETHHILDARIQRLESIVLQTQQDIRMMARRGGFSFAPDYPG